MDLTDVALKSRLWKLYVVGFIAASRVKLIGDGGLKFVGGGQYLELVDSYSR